MRAVRALPRLQGSLVARGHGAERPVPPPFSRVPACNWEARAVRPIHPVAAPLSTRAQQGPTWAASHPLATFASSSATPAADSASSAMPPEMAGVEDRFLNNGDVSIHYVEAGPLDGPLFQCNGDVSIHYVEAGPPDGPLVVLLHGFPSFWYTWKHQIGPLAECGYHVVAPDLRGYNLSSKPEGVRAYGKDPVLSDVSALLDHCGGPDCRAALVGHDWGGNIAWAFAQEFPHRVLRLAVLNMPYPQAFSRALMTDVAQMRRSWYIFLFQVPVLAEKLMSDNDHKFLKQVIRDDPVQRQSEEHTHYHVEAFSKPGAMTAAINYYRAILLHWGALGGAKATQVDMPVLVLWGEKDYVFEPYLVEPPRDKVPNARVVRFPEATHWLMWDQPEDVTRHILQFLEPLKGQGTAKGQQDTSVQLKASDEQGPQRAQEHVGEQASAEDVGVGERQGTASSGSDAGSGFNSNSRL